MHKKGPKYKSTHRPTASFHDWCCSSVEAVSTIYLYIYIDPGWGEVDDKTHVKRRMEKTKNQPPMTALMPPTPNPAPMPTKNESLAHGFLCNSLKSPSLIVFAASRMLVSRMLPPAVFIVPPGSRFAFWGRAASLTSPLEA